MRLRAATALALFVPCALLWLLHRAAMAFERLLLRAWWWPGCRPVVRRLLELQASRRVWRVFCSHTLIAWREMPREARPPRLSLALRDMRAAIRD